MEQIGIGIVGAGVRGIYCLGHAIAELGEETGLTVVGVFDVLPQRSLEAKRYLEQLYIDQKKPKNIRVYASYAEMLGDDACALVLITSFTNSHRVHAVEALGAGKKVYLDKPIAVTRADAAEIAGAARENPLIMGFTRRYERSWVKAKELLQSGVIGPLQMMEINSIVPYSRYLQTWHRRPELSGGAINDKCSHHFDVFNWMAGDYPTHLAAMGGRSSVFPVEDDAPKSCRVCTRKCEYRRDPRRQSDGAFVLQLDSWKNAEEEIERIDTCVYAPGSDIYDHAVVTVAYPSGIKASLFFSIFGPDTKDQEQLLLVGEKGKILVNRHEGVVTLDFDYGRNRETFDCRTDEFETSHFGADRDLVRTLRSFYEGEPPVATVDDGVVSLDMVLAVQESIHSGGQPVRFGTRVESMV